MYIYVNWGDRDILSEEDYIDRLDERAEEMLMDNEAIADFADDCDHSIWRALCEDADEATRESVCEDLREAALEAADADSGFEKIWIDD